MKFYQAVVVFLAYVCLASAAVTVREPNIDLLYQKLIEDQIASGKIHFRDNQLVSTNKPCAKECPENSVLLGVPGHVPNVNGCGSYNITLDFEAIGAPEFTQCCNVHDVCYEECGNTQVGCDNSFQGCLMGQCDKWAAEFDWNALKKLSCYGAAKVMYWAVSGLGCPAYLSSQENACYCS